MRTPTEPDLTDSLIAAKNLLGWKLVHDTPSGLMSGYIVETEAYSMDDEASHSHGGQRSRNVPMYKSAGTIYIYFIYGMHYCMNIVTAEAGRGQAVLIRALEPIDGINFMRQNRNVSDDRQLTNGPAKLVQAFQIPPSANGTRLGMSIRLEPGYVPPSITQTTRIGISKAKEKPWRFYITDNPYVSKL